MGSKPDLAVANVGSGISVLLGNGDGIFQAAMNYAAGSGSVSVAVGDLNGDSKPDLAVANLGNGISVLLGDGDGTFQAAVSYVAGSIPSSVAVGLQWGRQSRSGGGELWRQQRNDTSQHHCPGSAKGATSTTLTSSLNPSNVGHSEAIHDEISPSIVPISVRPAKAGMNSG